MSNKTSTTEDLSRTSEVQIGSERSFGLVFCVVFLIIGLFPLFTGNLFYTWPFIVSICFLVISLIKPVVLKPLNRLWFKFGMLLHIIVNPVVMGILFFIVLTPISLLARIFGERPLALKLDKSLNTYWHLRTPPGPKPESMKNQF